MRTCLASIEEIRASEEATATVIDSDNGDFIDDQADDKKGTGIRFFPIQVENFLRTLDSLEISSLKTDDTKCSICRKEYGKEKGNSAGLASDAITVTGDETPEYPVKLSYRHVFGYWCIKTWLLRQPACPTCRF